MKINRKKGVRKMEEKKLSEGKALFTPTGGSEENNVAKIFKYVAYVFWVIGFIGG